MSRIETPSFVWFVLIGGLAILTVRYAYAPINVKLDVKPG